VENDLLREELRALKSSHEVRIEDLEIKSRSSNLIFKGLSCPPESKYENIVVQFCKEILKVDVDANFIRSYPLGIRTHQPRPILTSFFLPKNKFDILRSLKVLKHTGFVVHQDLPEATRKKRTKLLLIRREINRLNPKTNARVASNSLIVNGQKFSWSMETGLLFLSDTGLPKLKELIGVDLTAFMKMVLEESLPKDYFMKLDNQKSQREANTPHRRESSSSISRVSSA